MSNPLQQPMPQPRASLSRIYPYIPANARTELYQSNKWIICGCNPDQGGKGEVYYILTFDLSTMYIFLVYVKCLYLLYDPSMWTGKNYSIAMLSCEIRPSQYQVIVSPSGYICNVIDHSLRLLFKSILNFDQ